MHQLIGTLRRQLLLLLALAIVPLAGVAVLLAIEDGRGDAARAQDEARAAAEVVSQNLSRLIGFSRDAMFGLSANPVIRDAGAGCASTLASIRPLFPEFAAIVVAHDYKTLCSDPVLPGSQAVPHTLNDDVVLHRVEQGRFGIGAIRFSRSTNSLVLPLLVPVRDRAGKVGEELAVGLDLKSFNDQIAGMRLPDQAILLVIDRYGGVIARKPPSPEFAPGKPAPDYEISLAGRPGFDREVTGADGIRRLYTVEPVPSGDGITVIMKVRSDQIYRASRNRLFFHLGGLLAVGMLVVGVTWLGSDRYFTRPLRGLIDAANRLAAGDFSARSEVSYTSEIGDLARSFDRMAEALMTERSRMLKTSETFRSIAKGVAEATEQEFFTGLVSAVAAGLGADVALVGEITPDGQYVSSLAICSGGKIVDNASFDLRGTPFENLSTQQTLYFARNAQALFPRDAMLRTFGMDSCLGTALVNTGRNAFGLIAVLNRGPIADDLIEPEAMLEIFAARARSELIRLRASRDLRQSLQENEQMVKTLRSLTARLEAVREQERTRIAREIHDELGQQLTALRFDLVNLKNSLAGVAPAAVPAEVPGFVSDLMVMVGSTISTVRRIATELRPGVLDTFGLVAGIEWLADDFRKRTQVPCIYQGPEQLQVDSELSTIVFRICQESLTNIVRHARATEVRICLVCNSTDLTLQVIDNGEGMPGDVRGKRSSLGILGMRERVTTTGGDFEVKATRGGGVTVWARLPVERPPEIDPDQTG